jgi:photosystem II stability/assembly factor-like uncharacterized protein
MEAEPRTHLSRRRWRALALIGLASTIALVVGFAYMRATGGPPATQGSAPTDHPLLTSLDFVFYSFVTPTVGWAIENPIQVGGFAVFKTTDGANHWQKQLATSSGSFGTADIAVQFLDQKHGYIAAADPFQELFRTSDGGDHWETARLPQGTLGLHGFGFSSSSYGWVLIVGRGEELYATSDAGATWQRLPNPPADADSLILRGPGEAWMGSSGAGTPHVYLSTDTGMSWQRRDVPPPPDRPWAGAVATRVELLGSGGVHVFIPPVVDPQMVALGLSETFTSFDQGATWNHVPRPPGVTGYQDSMHWWAMDGTSLFKSSDAGQSWLSVTGALPAWNYAPHILDSKHAWADVFVGSFGLALTQDGGLHWRQGTVPPPSSWISSG